MSNPGKFSSGVGWGTNGSSSKFEGSAMERFEEAVLYKILMFKF